jgi:hypothetical protein
MEARHLLLQKIPYTFLSSYVIHISSIKHTPIRALAKDSDLWHELQSLTLPFFPEHYKMN